jgi:caffeoyl-CoA O-methyltransferase
MESHDYCLSRSTPPSALAAELEAHTRRQIPGSNMLIGPLEASLLAVLIRGGGHRRVLELGTFTGYSSLIMAEALPADGTILTLDVNPGTTEVARKFWARSSAGHKITAVLAPGIDSLPTLTGTFDFVFIDADKVNYPFYVEWAHAHLSARGMIVIDNALWSGRVAEGVEDEHTNGIRRASALAAGFKDCVTSLLPVRDGMLLVQKIAL